MQNVVIVESPAKAKTINKYLGKDFQVLASFGHVRDLPSKDGSVLPDKDFEMIYEVDEDSKRHISEISKAVKKASHLYLATDPDREGEAISWHVLEALNENKALKKDVAVHRVVFNEITKKAVLDAVANPREIDMNLVNAQQARRALDYLVGFTLSPVLWRKLPGSRSAGRVQSVALRLICERDEEIEKFVAREYWDVRVLFHTDQQQAVPARLTHWQGEKLEKFSIPDGEKAKIIRAALESKSYKVLSVEPRQAQRHPAAPFTTSTLQQEAARKLGFSAKRTMQVAQKLYEGVTVGGETVGLITYMRTDGVTVSEEALKDARKLIGTKYGANYLPAEVKRYKVKTSNAQEAHEAIRPTDVARLPEDLESSLGDDERRLYELIWKRMIASQMQSAIFDQVAVDIATTDNTAQLRATGSVMKFDGFLKLYHEDRDDTSEDDEDEIDRSLPPLQTNQALTAKEITPQQHFTEPPPRYSEASLVKKLEELGIGRPSTYASIISVLQDRGYVRLDKKRFYAEMRGRVVNAFLVSFFTRYVEYDFTAQLEERLDEISAGEYDWKLLLRDFWEHFHSKVQESSKLKMSEVLEKLEQILAPVIFPRSENVVDPQTCPACKEGRLGLRLGKFGPFVGCANYPECNYTRELVPADKGEGEASAATEDLPKELGKDPATGMGVWLKRGPYGLYVQLGEDKKPRRSSIPKHMSPAEVTLEHALGLLSLPREVGMHPETGKPITAGLGRFGPYLHHDSRFISLKGDDDPVTVGINRAVALFAEAPGPRGRRGSVAPLRVLGKHPDDQKDVAVYEGRYGPYVKHGSTNATLPKDKEPKDVTLEEALELIAARNEKPGKKKRSTKKKKDA